MEFYVSSGGFGDIEFSQGCCYNRLNMYSYYQERRMRHGT